MGVFLLIVPHAWNGQRQRRQEWLTFACRGQREDCGVFCNSLRLPLRVQRDQFLHGPGSEKRHSPCRLKADGM